ncbi:neugrin [Hippocampus comes]|uniref:Neugrin n=1 Tax=Hippocampus comes TaxID=109280 RepID=A0A3Q2YMI1_HIPCM|nr:PREDICTED: neugrin [Hippocampus comes]
MTAGRLSVLSRWIRAVATSSACILKAVRPHPPSAFCRYASSKRVGKPRGIQNRARKEEDEDEEDPIMEEVEDKLNALLEESRKKQLRIKYNIMDRKMTPSGAPERTLTWEAMETIRYLKREHPDEWTIEHLAEGFSVSPAVIRRVVRNKFSPTAQRKAKQDAKVMSRLQRPALSSGEAGTEQSRPELPAGRSLRQFLPPGKLEAALVPVDVRTHEPPTKASALVTGPAMLPRRPKDAAATTMRPGEDSLIDVDPAESQDETWDGRVFSEEELDEFRDTKPAPAVQVGKDFFDGNGHFLYRI